MINSVIGGEFEIDLSYLSIKRNFNVFKTGYFYSSGRSAFYHILLYIKNNLSNIKTLLLPDYLCSSIIETVIYAGFKWETYPLSPSLQIDELTFSSLEWHNSAVLLINYFGLVEMDDQVRFLRSLHPDICIIEDNVQSFFSMWSDTASDFSFTSFRKTLPLPDGGWVKSKYVLEEPNLGNTFAQYKIAGSILKSFREYRCFDDSLYLDLLKKGEALINNDLDKGISKISMELLQGIDLHKIAVLRRRNAEFLIHGLSEMGLKPILELGEFNIPLFIPIYLEKRDMIRNRLFDNSIYCPVHWSVCKKNSFVSRGSELEKHELSLVIDQRYSLRDMDRILSILKG